MKSGIYCIKNDINDKVYVGKAKNLANRWEQHKSKLLKNNHDNIFLQQDFNEYGIDAFTFSVLEYVPEQPNLDKVLFAKEKEWGDKLNARDTNCGYNIANFQQQKENSYKEAILYCWNKEQKVITYITYHLPLECCLLYFHIIERIQYYGVSGVKENEHGFAILTLDNMALIINSTKERVKKLIVEMKKHGLIRVYQNRKDKNEYGFRLPEDFKYDFVEEINKRWKEI